MIHSRARSSWSKAMSNDDLIFEPHDAFPNAPGLSKELGLHKANRLPPEYNAQGHRWYSICSAHQKPEEGCPRCLVGNYGSIVPRLGVIQRLLLREQGETR